MAADSDHQYTSLTSERLDREQEFHDQWAASVDPCEVLVDKMFSLPSCPENRFLLSQVESLSKKRVLDLGTGLGEAAVFFAKQGADVTAIDISPGMLETCNKVASLHGVQLTTRVMSADSLDFPDKSFDIVYGANVLHHVNTTKCLLDVKRVLRPGGKALFFDPICYNPLINVYRRMADRVRTTDEHPLTYRDLRTMRKIFGSVTPRFFWLTTLVIFLKFYLVDRVHPNQERYWKKVLYDFESFSTLYSFLARFDRVLTKIPLLQWMAWNIAVVCNRSANDD